MTIWSDEERTSAGTTWSDTEQGASLASTFVQTLLAAANAAEFRALIGVGLGVGDVTLAGIQTLLNKTLTSPAINTPTITGGAFTGGTDIAVADGGTGASTAANARTNLGLGTIATQDAATVALTGGSVTGITDLAIADGGTGQSTAQLAVNALSAVAAATNEHVLTKDTGTGNATWKAAAAAAALPGSIYGWTYANNVADATNDIDIAAGGGMDSTGLTLITGTALIKRLDANWVVGTNQGGILSGSAADVDYNIWAIKRVDTSVVDIGFETTANATPTLPTNYTLYRKIGWFKRVGGTIVGFKTYETEGGGLEMNWNVPTVDVSLAATLTTTRRTDALKVPLTFSVIANISAIASGAAAAYIKVMCPDETDAAVSATNSNMRFPASEAEATQIQVRTSAAGLVASRASLATVDVYSVLTTGFQWGRR